MWSTDLLSHILIVSGALEISFLVVKGDIGAFALCQGTVM